MAKKTKSKEINDRWSEFVKAGNQKTTSKTQSTSSTQDEKINKVLSALSSVPESKKTGIVKVMETAAQNATRGNNSLVGYIAEKTANNAVDVFKNLYKNANINVAAGYGIEAIETIAKIKAGSYGKVYDQAGVDKLVSESINKTREEKNAKGIETIIKITKAQNKIDQGIEDKYAGLSENEKKVGTFLSNAGKIGPYALTAAVNPYAGVALMFADSAGDTEGNDLLNGATQKEAQRHGYLQGAIDAGTELLSGGVAGLVSKSGLMKPVTNYLEKNVTSNAIKKLLSRTAAITGEGAEEAAATFLSPLATSNALNTPYQGASAKDMLSSAAGGAAIAALFGGAQDIGSTLKGKTANGTSNIQQDTVDTQGINSQTSEVSPQENINQESVNTKEAVDTKQAQDTQDTQTNYTNGSNASITNSKEAQAYIDKIFNQQSTDGTKKSQFIDTLSRSPYATEEQINAIKESNIGEYTPISDDTAMGYAQNFVKKQGVPAAYYEWKAAIKSGKAMEKNTIALGDQLMVNAQSSNNLPLVMELAADMSEIRTRSGQALQASSMLKKATPIGKLVYIETIIKRLNNEKAKITKGKGEQITLNETLVDDLLNSKDVDGMYDAENAIMEDVAAQMPSTLGDKIQAWRYLAMLANPKTHIRNIIGNIAMSANVSIKNKIGAMIESLTIKDKSQRTKALLNPFSQEVRAAKQFAETDYQSMKDAIDGGKFETNNILKSESPVFSWAPLEKFRKFNMGLLENEDTFFLKKAYKNAFAQEMIAKDVTTDYLQSGTKEAEKTLSGIRERATLEAQKATFHDFSALAQALNNLEKKNIATKALVGGVIPFKKTPINILKRGVEYSPIGLAESLTVETGKLIKGTITASKYIDRVSSGLTGLGVAGVGYLLSSLGVVKGGADDNDRKEYYEQQQGNQPYSIKVLGKTVTLDWLAPASMPFFVGAAAYDMKDKNGNDVFSSLQNVMDALSSTADPLTQLSMLSGVNNIIDSVKYGGDGAAGTIGSLAGNMTQNYVSQFVPTVLGQVARTIDPVRRTTYASSESPLTKGIESAGRKMLNKIPFASMLNEPYVDSWGNQQTNDNLLDRVVSNFVNPSYIADINQTAADEELDRLYKATGESGVIPTITTGKVTNNGKTYSMTPSEKTQYSTTQGKTAKTILDKVVSSKGYISMSNEDKAETVKDVYEYAKYIADNEFLKSKGETSALSGSDTWKEKAKYLNKAGMPINDYIVFSNTAKGIEGEQYTDKYGETRTVSGTKKKAVLKYINTLKLNLNQKTLLAYIYGNYSIGKAETGKSDDENRKSVSDYVNSLSLTIEEKKAILKRAGYYFNGNKVYWK